MILSPCHRAMVIAHARQAAPAEACGILAGVDGRVRRVYRLPNIAETPVTRFLADPEAQLVRFREMERLGLEMLAVYHSHPRSLPVPSATDVEMAYYPEARQVIVSLAGRRPRIKCFVVRDGKVIEEALSAGRESTRGAAGRRPH